MRRWPQTRVPRIAPARAGVTPFQRLFHNAAILERWRALEAAFLSSPTFDAVLLEEIRRVLADVNGCEYCRAKGAPSGPRDLRDEAAQNLARAIAGDHLRVSESDIRALREFFSDTEIAELVQYCAFVTAAQKVGAVLGLEAACQLA